MPRVLVENAVAPVLAAATPFQTSAWLETWWRHYGRGRKPLLLTVQEGDDVLAQYPLLRRNRGARVIRPAGLGPSDYLPPLTISGESRASEALAEWLRHQSEADLVDLHQLRETEPILGHLSGTHRDQATCLVLDLPPTFDAYLQTLGKSLRYDVKRLDKLPGIRIVAAGEADVRQHLDVFLELHRKRWRQRGLPGAFLARQVRFHREWSARAVRDGILWLSTLEHEGRAVGSIYAMRTGDTCFFYQAGFDPEAKAISPGTLLVAHTIRRAIEEGCTRFDFLRGDEPYKRRWKPQHVLQNRRVLLPLTPLGRTAEKWNLQAADLEDRVRNRLEGQSLFRQKGTG